MSDIMNEISLSLVKRGERIIATEWTRGVFGTP